MTAQSRLSAPLFLYWCLLSAAAGIHSDAQAAEPYGFQAVITQSREVIVLPSSAVSGYAQSQAGLVSGSSYETPSLRVHVVHCDGAIYRAATPLEGPYSRIAFDPMRRSFARLLPSIRVELSSERQLESAKSALGAEKADFFAKLGFAIIYLPDAVHPLDAIAELAEGPGRHKATIRLSGPRIKWR